MKGYKASILMSVFFLCSCSIFNQNTVEYCGRNYLQKPEKVYLVDENIEATMMQLIDKKTKKFAFGHFMHAIKNDTNFIYSKLAVHNDTLYRTTYRPYGITPNYDSSIAKFVCNKNGIKLYNYKQYYKGEVVTENFF